MSQSSRLYDLLSDGLPHRVDEIVREVYNMEGSTVCRIAGRVFDLKTKYGVLIESWPDPQNKKLWYYKLTPSYFDFKKKELSNFLKKIIKTESCWNWIGALDKDGYGIFTIQIDFKKRKNVRAHRYSYELQNNKLEDEFLIDHLCKNKRCVNPDHLEKVTPQENTLRGNSFAAINSKKTHCLRGHLLSPENTYLSKKNERNCIICVNLRQRINYQKRKIKIDKEWAGGGTQKPLFDKAI